MKNQTSRGMSSGSFAKRRQRDRKDVEPIIQVGAESAFLHRGIEIVMRGRDDADVDLPRLRRANPFELAFLEHAQQLGLDVRRQVADFVQKQRPGVRHLETPATRRDRAGECAAFVTE